MNIIKVDLNKRNTCCEWLKAYVPVIMITLIMIAGCEDKSLSKDPAVLLKSTNEDAQAHGASLIYHSKKYDEQFIPLLINVLKTSKSSGAKCNALLAIACYKEKAAAAIPEIIRLLDDRDKTVVSNAVGALGEIKSSPAISLLALQKIAERDKELRGLAYKAIGEFGKNADYVVPAMIKYANDPDTDTRAEVRNALRKITSNQFWNSAPENVELQLGKASTFKPTQLRFENILVKTIPDDTKQIHITRDQNNGRKVSVCFENIQYADVSAFISFLENKRPGRSFLIIHEDTADSDIVEIIKYCVENKLDLYREEVPIIAGCKYQKYISVSQEPASQLNE